MVSAWRRVGGGIVVEGGGLGGGVWVKRFILLFVCIYATILIPLQS